MDILVVGSSALALLGWEVAGGGVVVEGWSVGRDNCRLGSKADGFGTSFFGAGDGGSRASSSSSWDVGGCVRGVFLLDSEDTLVD